MKSHSVLLSAILPFALVACGPPTGIREPVAAAAEVEHLLGMMRQRYRSCRTYEDTGNVMVTMTHRDPSRNVHVPRCI